MGIHIIKHNNPDLTNTCIAGFDFDWTLIRPKGATTWCCNRDDWTFLYNNCKSTLERFHNEGYTIVIITYQTRKYKIELIKDFVEMFDIPLYVIISDGEIQKNFKLIDYLELGYDRVLNTHVSFYCGDADGDQGSWSNMDLVFAVYNNIRFCKPATIFGEEYVSDVQVSNVDLGLLDNYDVIIMCGSPGSGKSTFVKNNLVPKGYSVVSSDEHKSNKSKMAKEMKTYLKERKPVVIDACNPTITNRMYWKSMLKDEKCLIILVDVEKSIAIDRNAKREVHKVPIVAIHTWYKRFDGLEIDMSIKSD